MLQAMGTSKVEKTTVSGSPDAQKRMPPNAGKGRKPGVPNKVTQEFRVTIQKLLDDNRENIGKWVEQVANGIPPIQDAQGRFLHPGRPGDPAQALRCLGHLADFAAPRLSRAEVTGEAGGPLNVIIHKIA
jgi:hypothetical protein